MIVCIGNGYGREASPFRRIPSSLLHHLAHAPPSFLVGDGDEVDA